MPKNNQFSWTQNMWGYGSNVLPALGSTISSINSSGRSARRELSNYYKDAHTSIIQGYGDLAAEITSGSAAGGVMEGTHNATITEKRNKDIEQLNIADYRARKAIKKQGRSDMFSSILKTGLGFLGTGLGGKFF